MGKLTKSDKEILLKIAREAIEQAVRKVKRKLVTPDEIPAHLNEPGASFVTLTIDGRLRGCIGTMEAYQPLVSDVEEHAVAAALSDYRFPRVSAEELSKIKIEVSYLTPLQELTYSSSSDLCSSLRIGIDGVLIKANGRSATFLPQVWEQLPNPEEFLSHLCMKMGAAPDLWQDQHMEVYIYQVEKFCEP